MAVSSVTMAGGAAPAAAQSLPRSLRIDDVDVTWSIGRGCYLVDLGGAYEPLPVRRLYESAIGTVHETLEAAVQASIADHQAGVQHYSEVA